MQQRAACSNTQHAARRQHAATGSVQQQVACSSVWHSVAASYSSRQYAAATECCLTFVHTCVWRVRQCWWSRGAILSSCTRPSYIGSYVGTSCGACAACKGPELTPADCSGVVGFVLYCCTCYVTWSIACYMLGEGVMSCTVRSTRMWSASNLHFYFEVALLVPPVRTCSITLLVRLSYASDAIWSMCSSSSRTASALSPSTATALRCMQHDHAECWSKKKSRCSCSCLTASLWSHLIVLPSLRHQFTVTG